MRVKAAKASASSLILNVRIASKIGQAMDSDHRREPMSQRSARATSIWEPCYAPAPPRPRKRSSINTRTLGVLFALVSIFGLLLIVMTSTPALSQAVSLVKVDVAVVGKAYRASKMVGTSVTNDKNESIGKLDDLLIDNKNVVFAVLQIGGFLGLGSRLVVVPYDSLKIAEGGKKIVLPGASKEELNKLTEFKYL
jgi:sporulation protein YlmC with PRC-barrel domain